MKSNGYLAVAAWGLIFGSSIYLFANGGETPQPEQEKIVKKDKTPVKPSPVKPKPGAEEEFRWVSYSEALQGDKPILVHFGADWCGPCKNLERTVLTRPEIIARLQRFSCVLLNVDHRWDKNQTVKRVWNPSGLPYEVIIDPITKKELKRGPVPSTLQGYTRYQDNTKVFRSVVPGKKNTYVWKLQR